MNQAVRILAVGDVPLDRREFSELLSAQGYEIYEASTATEALAFVQASQPDVVLLNASLPGGAGIEACRKIKADASLADVFVILFSGEATGTDSVAGGLEVGADDCISKGMDPKAFLARIRSVLRLQETARALRASEERFKRVQAQVSVLAQAVESTAEPICITDLQDRFIFVNQAFQRNYGYSEAELLGKTPELLFSSGNPPALLREILEQSRLGGWQGELLDKRKDGTEFPVFLSTSQIKDQEGKTVGLLGVARDITQRKLLEKRQWALAQLGYRLSGVTTPEAAAKVIWEITATLFELDAGYVGLYDPLEKKIGYVLATDTVDGDRKIIPPTGQKKPLTPLMHLVMKEGAQLIHRSAEAAKTIAFVKFGDCQRSSECMLYAPITWSGTVFGIISVQSYRRGAYSEEDLKMLQTIADHCGNTLKRIAVTEALREAEASYRGIFENATEGFYRSTPEGRILAANPALARMFGFASSEEYMTGVTNLAEQVYADPGKRDEFKALLEKNGVVQGFEAELYRKDGSKIWVSLNSHVTRDAKLGVLYYEGTIQDITEKKEAAERLADAQELTRTILASSSLGILAYRHTGECVFANEGAAKIFNLSVGLLMKQNFRELEHWRKTGLLRLAEETLRTRTFHEQEERWLSPAGKEVWLNCRFASFVSGGELHLLKLTDDISKRKQAEAELRLLPGRIIEAQEAERLRVAGDLHDSVNQLIAAAKVRLGSVQDAIAEASPATGEIVSRANALLVQALEENRRVAHNLRPSDLDEFGLLTACRNFCREFRSRTRIAVRCYLKEPAPALAPASELNLFRIMQEAFYNIEKHAKAKNASLRIKVRHQSLVMEVRDDGKGFDAGAPRRSRKKRHGIGLNNIRERAALIGGTIVVNSEPRRGTTILVRVPLGTSK